MNFNIILFDNLLSVYIFYLQDVAKLSERMTNLIYSYRIPLPSFNHMDFLFANDVKKLVYNNLLAQLAKFKKN